MNGWQPIATCPREVTRALLLYPAFKLADGELTTEPAGEPLVTMGFRNVGGGWEEIDPTLEATGEFFGDDWEYGEPTHWYPMPAPPRADALEAPRTEVPLCKDNEHDFGICKVCGMPWHASRLEPPTAEDIAWAARSIHDENIADTASHPDAIHYGLFETCDAPSCVAVRAAALDAAPESKILRALLRRFVEKLDVILPKVDGIIAFNTVRSGHEFYDGPNLIDEMRDAKALLAADGGAMSQVDLPRPTFLDSELHAVDLALQAGSCPFLLRGKVVQALGLAK